LIDAPAPACGPNDVRIAVKAASLNPIDFKIRDGKLKMVLDRKPPLALSRDAGTTWSEAGRGLPPGRAIAIRDDDPDTMLYAARNRLYLSSDGGRFWHALAPELPEIAAIAFAP